MTKGGKGAKKKNSKKGGSGGRDTWNEADSGRRGGGGGGGKTSAASSRADLKVAELTANFEQGLELKKLREELERSKQSMSESNKFIDSATQQWFKK
jgi:hypothetical protein